MDGRPFAMDRFTMGGRANGTRSTIHDTVPTHLPPPWRWSSRCGIQGRGGRGAPLHVQQRSSRHRTTGVHHRRSAACRRNRPLAVEHGGGHSRAAVRPETARTRLVNAITKTRRYEAIHFGEDLKPSWTSCLREKVSETASRRPALAGRTKSTDSGSCRPERSAVENSAGEQRTDTDGLHDAPDSKILAQRGGTISPTLRTCVIESSNRQHPRWPNDGLSRPLKRLHRITVAPPCSSRSLAYRLSSDPDLEQATRRVSPTSARPGLVVSERAGS